MGSARGRRALLAGFRALGFAPAGGFGASLGAALAGLPEAEFEGLAFQAEALSLLDSVASRPEPAWRVHPLLAELLRDQQSPGPAGTRPDDGLVRRAAA
jgi:hypothetical protein